jgi:hypothetical protein
MLSKNKPQRKLALWPSPLYFTFRFTFTLNYPLRRFSRRPCLHHTPKVIRTTPAHSQRPHAGPQALRRKAA